MAQTKYVFADLGCILHVLLAQLKFLYPSCTPLVCLSFCEAMELLEVLAPMRSSAEDALATQIEVFEDGHHGDQTQLDMPGDVDISSHNDLFSAVFARVREISLSLSLSLCIYSLSLSSGTTGVQYSQFTVVSEHSPKSAAD